MAVVPRITALDFLTELQNAILALTTQYDVAAGPIPDTILSPVASVLENQNDRLRQVSLLISLENLDQFSTADVGALIYNEGLTLGSGDAATGTVTFFRQTFLSTDPDVTIPRGFPVASGFDSTTGQSITVYTTAEASMLAASAASYYNATRGRYEVSVGCTAVIGGSGGNIGPNRATRPLRGLPAGLQGVTNLTRMSNGSDPETATQAGARYLLAVMGRQLATPVGLERWTRDQFTTVQTVSVVYGTDSDLTRTSTVPNAVDIYIRERSLTTVTDTLTFLGVGQVHVLSTQPVDEVVSVSVGTTADWQLVRDESDNAGSIRAQDGIQFLSTYAGTVGTAFTVTYNANATVIAAQTAKDSPDTFNLAADELFKQGTEVPLYISARLRVRSGIDYTTMVAAVRTALGDYINTLPFGSAIEESDLNGLVRTLTGVDNFIIDRMSRDPGVITNTDFTLERFEFPTLDTTLDLVITAL